MYNILASTFKNTLEREGKTITVNGIAKRAFFRRNDKGDKDAYVTVYMPCTDCLKQGDVFTLNKDKYMVQKALTDENEVYRKFSALKINTEIKWQFGKNDLVVFPTYMKEISDSLNANANGITVSSKGEFLLPLSDNSKRISINNRFFAGAYKLAWKITDINYLNNMICLYCQRDVIQPNDDAVQGIANKYEYENRPSTYKVVFENMETITIEEFEEKTVKYAIYKDGALIENPPLTQTFIIDNGKYMIADGIDTTDTETVTEEYFKIHVNNDNISTRIEQGQITIVGMIQGTSRITASYSISTEDTVISDTIDVNVIEKAVVASDVIITPVYTDDAYFRLKENRTQMFTADITGVENPVWNITINNNEIAENTYYTAIIDNLTGKFTVKNITKNTSKNLVFTVREETSGKTVDYQIKLWGMI